MEQNPSELEVTPVEEASRDARSNDSNGSCEPVVQKPKRAGTRVPKKAREQIERAKRESEAQASCDPVVIQEPEPVSKVPDNQILKCECGCDIMPQANGLYPSRCPECGTWNDYRGVKFLEQSANILVCDKCGGLTLITPETVCCEHCGARP